MPTAGREPGLIVAARALAFRQFIGPNAQAQRNRYEADVREDLAEVYPDLQGGDRVGTRITEFVAHIEQLCRPIIDRSYSGRKMPAWWTCAYAKRVARRLKKRFWS
jgi:hypothetical protein